MTSIRPPWVVVHLQILAPRGLQWKVLLSRNLKLLLLQPQYRGRENCHTLEHPATSFNWVWQVLNFHHLRIHSCLLWLQLVLNLDQGKLESSVISLQFDKDWSPAMSTEVLETPKAMMDIQSCTVGINRDWMKIFKHTKTIVKGQQKCSRHFVQQCDKSTGPVLTMSISEPLYLAYYWGQGQSSAYFEWLGFGSHRVGDSCTGKSPMKHKVNPINLRKEALPI